MASPIRQSGSANQNQQDTFTDDVNNSNVLGILNLGNNFEEIRTFLKRKMNKNKKTAQFIVTDITCLSN